MLARASEFERVRRDIPSHFLSKDLKKRINNIPDVPLHVSPEDYYRIILTEYHSLIEDQKNSDCGMILLQWLENYKTKYKLPLDHEFRNKLENWAHVLLEQFNKTIYKRRNIPNKDNSNFPEFEQIIQNDYSQHVYDLLLCKSIEDLNKIARFTENYPDDPHYTKLHREIITYIENEKILQTLPLKTSDECNFKEIREIYFSELTVNIKKNNNRHGVDIVMSTETRNRFFIYLEIIKERIRNKKIDFFQYYDELSSIGVKLFRQLKEFIKESDEKIKDNQRILNMTVEDFIACLLKTTKTNFSSKDKLWLHFWNDTEYRLLTDTPKIVMGSANTLAKRTRCEDDIINFKKRSQDNRHFDTVYFHAPIINPSHVTPNQQFDFHKLFPKVNLDIDKLSHLDFNEFFKFENYKAILSNQFLPVLKFFSSKYKGFILTFPELQCDNFSGIPEFNSKLSYVFEKAIQEIIIENNAAFPNLEAVIYLGKKDLEEKYTELKCNKKIIPFIKTNKDVGSEPLLKDKIFNQFKVTMGQEKYDKLLLCNMIKAIQINAFTCIVKKSFANNVTQITELTKEKELKRKEVFDDIFVYRPIKRENRHNHFLNSELINNLSFISCRKNPALINKIEVGNPSKLYNQAFALIHSQDFDNNEISKIRFCGLYIALANSKNENDKTLAKNLRKYFPVHFIENHLRNYPVVILAQVCLSGLFEIETVNSRKKMYLKNFLTNLFNQPQDNTKVKLLKEKLKEISNDLKNNELISLFGRHRLRDYIDNFLKSHIFKRCCEIKRTSKDSINFIWQRR